MRDEKDSDQRRTSSDEGRWLLKSKAFGSSNRDSPMIAGRFPLLFISLTLLVIDWFLHYLSPSALRLRRRSSATPVLCIYRTLYKILIRRSIYFFLLQNHIVCMCRVRLILQSMMVATRYMGSPRRLCYAMIDCQHQAPSICYCVGTDGGIVAPGPILSLLIYCSVGYCCRYSLRCIYCSWCRFFRTHRQTNLSLPYQSIDRLTRGLLNDAQRDPIYSNILPRSYYIWINVIELVLKDWWQSSAMYNYYINIVFYILVYNPQNNK